MALTVVAFGLLPDLRAALTSRFGVFLVAWPLTMVGVQTFFDVLPLSMRDAFDVSPSASSLLFLMDAAIGTLVFPACGKLADAHGPGIVFAIGAMTAASITNPSWKAVVGSVALVVAATAYSFLASAFGYYSLPAMATASLVAALLVALPVIRAGVGSKTARAT